MPEFGIVSAMDRAALILEDKQFLDDGTIVEMRIWRVPNTVPPSVHGLKYALFFGRPGERIVLFDNERGKSDHKHIRDVETAYSFTSVQQLVADFLAAVQDVRRQR